MLEPVGPLPPSVYWRRRAVAAAAVVGVLALLVWAIAAGSSADGGSGAPVAAPAPAGVPSSGPPSPVASRGALPAPGGAGPLESTLSQPGAAALLGAPGLPGSPSQTGTGALPGAPGASPAPSGAVYPGAASPGAGPGTWQKSDPGAPSTAPAPSAPAPSAPSPPPAQCADGSLRVTARTDQPRYAEGEHPLFSLVITNTGSVPCTRDLDAARQAMAVVRKPGDGLWGSNDCSPAHSSDVRTLAPGQDATFTVRWAGRTSLPGCAGERTTVPPGDYQLLTRLDGIVSDPTRFTLAP
jgi:hypothetical protein